MKAQTQPSQEINYRVVSEVFAHIHFDDIFYPCHLEVGTDFTLLEGDSRNGMLPIDISLPFMLLNSKVKVFITSKFKEHCE